MSGLRYWYAENRGAVFAFGLFVLMFVIYLFNYPSTLSANVFQTAANKAVLLALVSMGQALVVLTAGSDLQSAALLALAGRRAEAEPILHIIADHGAQDWQRDLAHFWLLWLARPA